MPRAGEEGGVGRGWGQSPEELQVSVLLGRARQKQQVWESRAGLEAATPC